MRHALACCVLALPLWGQESHVRTLTPKSPLSDDVVPRKYTVTLTIDPNRSTFDGEMRIKLEARKNLPVLWLNAKGLMVKDAGFLWGETLHPSIPAYKNDELAGFPVDANALPQSPELIIHYQGRLDDKGLAGPYRRKVDGQWYVYTTFTPIDARRAFPCFDEPRFKAPWDISIRVKREHKAFSNGREISETDEPGGWKMVKFATTEPLPA
jgi:alanyl aminopeptidase